MFFFPIFFYSPDFQFIRYIETVLSKQNKTKNRSHLVARICIPSFFICFLHWPFFDCSWLSSSFILPHRIFYVPMHKMHRFFARRTHSKYTNTHTHRPNNNSNRESYLACCMLRLDAFNLCTHFGVLQRFFQFVFSKSMAIVTCCYSSQHTQQFLLASHMLALNTLYHVVCYEVHVTKCFMHPKTHGDIALSFQFSKRTITSKL